MDGLSGAASVVAILQLLESVVRLVEFGKSVRDAPANIEALFNDLDLLSQVLDQTQDAAAKIQLEGAIEPALRDCQKKITIFHTRLSSATSHLKSDSFRRRTWSALKSALKSNEIALLRQSIADTKATLTLALQSTFLHCIASSMKENRGRTLTLPIESLPLKVHEENIMQLPAPQCHLIETAPLALSNSASDFHFSDVNGQGQFNPSHQPLLDLLESQDSLSEGASWERTKTARSHLSSWNKRVTTPLVRINTRRTTFEILDTGNDEPRKKIEIEQTSILYPTRLGQILGISKGVLITGRSTVGWQYTLQPFRAVPENALIFDLCRTGNTDGVKSLLERGEASPLDRDPMGRTPLWVAAKSLKIEVADLLLRVGADPHAQDWKSNNEPIAAVADSEGFEMKPKLLMINLLHNRRRDDYEDMNLMFMLGIFFLKYRPQSNISMTWEQKRLEVLAVMRALLRTIPSSDEGDINRGKILSASIRFYFVGDVLRYVLKGIRGSIDGYEDQSHPNESVIHEAVFRRLLERDPESMRMIMQKTKNMHRLAANGCIGVAPHTPTMLAMYDPSLFIAWRTMLQDLGLDAREFVRKELEQGALGDAGWTESSLTHLFHMNITADQYDGPRVFGFPTCERCGHNGTALGSRLIVDLGWRRHLREIRQHYAKMFPAISNCQNPQSLRIVVEIDRKHASSNSSTISRTDWLAQDPDLSSRSVKHLPYRVVCSTECMDGLCVAWLYENNLNIEPNFPLYPQEPATVADLAGDKNSMLKDEDHLEVKVPGAFVD